MDAMERCLIIAAGMGSRLASRGEIKPLVEVNEKPLIHHVMDALAAAGIHDFTFVLGCQADRIGPRVMDHARKQGLEARILINEGWQRANGVSVLRAEATFTEPFVLTMCDHLYPPELVSALLAYGMDDCALRLAVDRRLSGNPLVDLDDVTRVRTQGDRIVDIGKNLTVYDAFDTGVFSVSPELFGALHRSIERGDESLSGGVRQLAAAGRAAVADIGSVNWLDVDDEAALAKAEAWFTQGGGPFFQG